MKKLLALFLTLTALLTLAACGGEKSPTEESDSDQTTVQEPGADAPLGKTLAAVFLACDDAASCQTIAEDILAQEAILFAGQTSPVTPGLLTGFGNEEITGFSDGVMFAPVIGSIPFVGYVFQLSSEAETADFVHLLQENANPRWNVCTEAEETVIQEKGDKVFFLMCPTSLEA